MSVLAVKIISLIIAAGIIGFNVYLTFDGNPSNSLSEIVRSSVPRIPIITWIYGFLGGHWFHPGNEPIFGFWPGFFIIMAITLGIQVFARYYYPEGLTYGAITSLFFLGFIAGAHLWPT